MRASDDVGDVQCLSYDEIASRFTAALGSAGLTEAEYFEAVGRILRAPIAFLRDDTARQIGVETARVARALHPELREECQK